MMQKRTLLMALLMACMIILAGCAKEGPQETEPTAAPVEEQGGVERMAVTAAYASDTLVGFIAPQNKEINVRTSLHGFLRTAEALGFPAKVYYAAMGTGAAQAVNDAHEDGCMGLLIWNPNGGNKEAIARAAALSIPVVVPYHTSGEPGVTANVAADMGGYAEEVALGVAERMVERDCKAGKILVYGGNPLPVYDVFQEAIAAYYPQYNVGYFFRAAQQEQAAIDELATYILWNRDIKGLFCVDTDGARIAVRAREQAQKEFKSNGAPETARLTATPEATAAPKATAAPTPTPGVTPTTPTPTPGGAATGGGAAMITPVPEGLIKSITISVAGYGLTDDTVALMNNNDIYAFVLEPYYEASAQSLMLLDRILRRETVPQTTRLNMPIVRMATLDKYILIREQVLEWFNEGV
ncbi:MAG: hypothetical protein LBS18_02570 [Clostridiales bacterium]|jgi:ABC-type sugar transport system substrate-binding protein|nr:hypothetical protein [Clostridiales bacterium]